jgi:hypothetical protein
LIPGRIVKRLIVVRGEDDNVVFGDGVELIGEIHLHGAEGLELGLELMRYLLLMRLRCGKLLVEIAVERVVLVVDGEVVV